MPQSEFDITAEEQAARWRAQLSSDLATSRQQHEFAAWLAANAEHKAAWDKVDTFWQALDNVPATELDLADTPTFVSVNATPQKPAFRRFYRSALGLAVSVLLAIAIMAKPFSFYFADYRTETGQQRQVNLADGSEIFMNTQTALSVDYSARQRKIRLHAGEAYFKVAPDQQHPFIVETEMGQTQALGTAFDIKLQDGETAVTVFEHAVKITTAHGKTIDKLSEGERAVFSDDSLKASEKILPGRNPGENSAWFSRTSHLLRSLSNWNATDQAGSLF